MSESHVLPKGWASADLASLADIVRGVTYRKPDASKSPAAGLVPLLRATNIGRGLALDSDLVYVPERYVSESQRLRAGDIVVAASSGSISVVGKSAQLSSDWPGTFGAFCCVVRPREDMDARYLAYFVLSEEVRQSWSRLARGTNINNLKISDIGDTEVPVAPAEEQVRIVAAIEEQFSRIEAGVESLEHARRNLQRMRSSVLQAAVTGRLSRPEPTVDGPAIGSSDETDHESDDGVPLLPSHWTWATSGELLTFVTSGSRGWAKYYADDGPLFIRIGNLDHGSIRLDLSKTQHVRPPAGTEGTRTRVRTGDILISITADVGMVALAPDDLPEAYINQHIALARPCEDVYKPYLAWAFASPLGKHGLRHLQRGATKVGLGLDDIRSVRVPLPPFDEQQSIVADIERNLSVIEALEQTLRSTERRADSLRRATLGAAFAGRLVAQDPSDEPARVLAKPSASGR